MAERYVYLPKNSYPFYSEEKVSFHYFAGFALVQKQKNINALHEGYLKEHPTARILEASSKSASTLGKSLSPFYLLYDLNGYEYPVENVFQASKVFATGGPYPVLLEMPAIKAKTTSMTKTKGALLYYEFEGQKYPLQPYGWLFSWIYIKALLQHPKLAEQVLDYDGFTDIAFNPKKGHSCQAIALAVYCSLKKKNLLEQAVSSIPAFLKTVFRYKLPEAELVEPSEKADERKEDHLNSEHNAEN